MTDQEINEAVARKLGWEDFDDPRATRFEWRRKSDNPKRDQFVVQLPDYCHDIKAAWEVVEKMASDGYSITVGQNPCRCLAWKTHEDFNAIQEADTAPMAICKAFLKLPN